MAIQVPPTRVKLAESARNLFVVNAPQGAIVQDCQDPAFWALIAERLRPFDKIEIRADDGQWYAEAVVRQSGKTWAIILITFYHSFADDEVVPSDEFNEYEVFWRGPHHKWSVKRRSDNGLVKGGFDAKEQAYAWLAEYQKAVA